MLLGCGANIWLKVLIPGLVKELTWDQPEPIGSVSFLELLSVRTKRKKSHAIKTRGITRSSERDHAGVKLFSAIARIFCLRSLPR